MTGSVVAYTGNDIAINGILLNSISDQCIWTVEDLEGWWGLPEATAPDHPRSTYEDGSTAVAGRYLARKLVLKGNIVPTEPNADGDAFSVAARNALNRALNLIRNQGVLQVNDSPPKMAYVQIIERPLTKFTKNNDVLEFEITLRAADPRKYDIISDNLSTTAYLGNIGRTYDKVYDYTYGGGEDSGLLNAYNEGTYETFGKIVINGPVINPTVEHVISGAHLSFDISLAQGEYLEIDLAVHTVYLNGTANRRTALLPSSSWFSLAPGDNFLKFSATQNPPPQHATDDRTNLIINPNATSGSAQGWVARLVSDSISVTSVPGVPSDNVFRVTANTTNDKQWGFETAASARPPVVAGDVYALSLNMRNLPDFLSSLSNFNFAADISFYDVNGTLLKTHEGTSYSVPTDRFVRVSALAQAPVSAVKASVFVRPTNYASQISAVSTGGAYFDDVLFERVSLGTLSRENIVPNGNLTRNTNNWERTNPDDPSSLNSERYYYASGLGVPTVSEINEITYDWFLNDTVSDATLINNRFGYKYTLSSGFIEAQEYVFAATVRSTVSQNWAIKIKALAASSNPIAGADGSEYITKGVSTSVSPNSWARISSSAVVPVGTAALEIIIEPAYGDIFAINAVVNPSFERTAEEEPTLLSRTLEPFTPSSSFTSNVQQNKVIKENWAANGDGRYGVVFPAIWLAGSYGTAGVGSFASTPTGGVNNGYGMRKIWTTAPTTPATQTDLGITYRISKQWTSLLGKRPPLSARAWVVPSKTSNHQISIEFLSSLGATVSTYTGLASSITTAGGWVTAENIDTNAFSWDALRLHVGPFAAGFTPAIGDAITVSGIVLEWSATSTPYFSGSVSDRWNTAYGYSGSDLFGGLSGPTTRATDNALYRKNWARNPRPFSSTTGWLFQNGTTGASTLSTNTTEVGPTDQLGFRRATITTADTAGNSGHFYREDATVTDGLSGDTVAASIWVRSSAAITVLPSFTFRAAGVAVGSPTTGSSVVLTPNTWTRLSVTATATGAYDGLQLWAVESVAGPAIGTTIDATSVLIERSFKTDIITNIVNDPGFETTGSSTPLLTNFLTNPSFETNTTGWGGSSGTLSRQTTGGFAGTSYARVTATAAGTITSLERSSTDTVVAGEAFSFSAYVKGTVGRTAYIRATWTGAAATDGPTATLASTSAWQRIAYTGIVPVGATAVRLDIVMAAIGVFIGSILDVDAVLALRGYGAVPTYFDGATAAAGDFTYTWTGTAHGSTSTQSALAASAAVSGVNAFSYSSTVWAASGSRSLAVQASNDSFSSYVAIAPQAALTMFNEARNAVIIGQAPTTWQITYNSRRSVAAQGPFDQFDNCIAVAYTRETTGATVYLEPIGLGSGGLVGVHDHYGTISLPRDVNTIELRAYNGGPASDGIIWFDNLMVVERTSTTYTARIPFFTGASIAGGGKTYAWTGTVNNSPSIAYKNVSPIVDTYFDGETLNYRELARNFVSASHPQGTTDWSVVAGTGGTAAVSYIAQPGVTTTGHVRALWTVASTVSGAMLQVGSAGGINRLSSAKNYSLGMWIRPSIDINAVAGVQFVDASGANAGSVLESTSEIKCPANVWTLVKYENVTSPASTASAVIYVKLKSTVAIGVSIDGDQALMVESSVLPAYFDGSTTTTDGKKGQWLGTSNNSQSLLLSASDKRHWWDTNTPYADPSVETYVKSHFAYEDFVMSRAVELAVSSEHADNASQGTLRVVPTTDSNDTYVDFATLLPSQDVWAPNYTVFATISIDRIQTGSLSPSARRLAWVVTPTYDSLAPEIVSAISDPLPNVPGTYKIKWSSTLTNPDAIILRVYNGAARGGGDIVIEDIAVVPVKSFDYDAPYYAKELGTELHQLPSVNDNTLLVRTGVADIYQNNVENPKFAYTNSRESDITRTNLLSEPRGTVASTGANTGWVFPTADFGLINTIEAADGPEGRMQYLRSANNPTNDAQYNSSSFIAPKYIEQNLSLIDGMPYTFSVWVRALNGGRVSLDIVVGDSSSLHIQSEPQYLLPNVWTRLYQTFIFNAGTSTDYDSVTASILFSQSDNSSTQAWDYGSAMLEQSDDVKSYFDGSLSTTSEYVRGWVGTANASRSIQVQTGNLVLRQNLLQSPTPYGQIGSSPASMQWNVTAWGTSATGVSGTNPSISDKVFIYTVAPVGTTTATINTTAGSSNGVPVVPGLEYAFSVDTVATKALSTSGTRAQVQWFDKNNTSISTTLGSYAPYTAPSAYARRSVLSVAPSGARYAKPALSFHVTAGTLGIGDAIGGTNALFEQTNKVDTFFSGSSPVSASLDTFMWDGVQNNSASSLVESRKIAVRTNYAREAVPQSTASTRWTYTTSPGEVVSKSVLTEAGPGGVPGVYWTVSTTPGSSGSSVWNYAEKISGFAGDTYTGSMSIRVSQLGTALTSSVTAQLTYKLAGVTVNTASSSTATLNPDVWYRLAAPAVGAAGAFDEIVIQLSTNLATSPISGVFADPEMKVTQALIEKTSQNLDWFDANNPPNNVYRKNYAPDPSFEGYENRLYSDLKNYAVNSGPFESLTGSGVGVWSSLPALGATLNTQLIQDAIDAPTYGAPNYVRNVWSTATTVSGEKGIQFLSNRTSAQTSLSAQIVSMYVRSSAAVPAKLVVTSEDVSSVVVATASSVSSVNLVPDQWTLLRATLPGSTFNKVRVKAIIGTTLGAVPAGTTLDASSVALLNTEGAYFDVKVPMDGERLASYAVDGVTSSMHDNYQEEIYQNRVLDPTLQYGAADWTSTPGWGTSGTGTSLVELGKGLSGGYSLVRRWTSTPSNSASLDKVGAGYLFKSAVATRYYSFTTLFSASKDTVADAWVTWYTDATLSTVVQTNLLSSTAYSASEGSVFIAGDGVLAPATAGFGLFTVGTWAAGFNPTNGDWMSVSNMRIDEGRKLNGNYFDAYTLSSTENRYRVEGSMGLTATKEFGLFSRFISPTSTVQDSLDSSWADSGRRSLRLTPVSHTTNDTYATLYSEAEIIDTFAAPADAAGKTFTVSATIHIGPEGHAGTHTDARKIVLRYEDSTGFHTVSSLQASPSANSTERLSVAISVVGPLVYSEVRLYNGAYRGNGEVWWDDVMIELQSSTDMYFDGDSPSAAMPAGYKAIWTGIQHASTSIVTNLVSDYVGVSALYGSDIIGVRPYGVDTYNETVATQVIRGASTAASTYVRASNFASVSDDVYMTVGGGPRAMRLGMEPGKTYTALASLLLENVQTTPVHADARKIGVFYKTSSSPTTYQSFLSSAAPNVTGNYDLRVLFTLPADTLEAYLVLNSGSGVGTDRLLWTNVAVVAGYYSGPYFDGDTTWSISAESTEWLGTSNISRSVVRGLYPSQVVATNSKVVKSDAWAATGTYSLKIIPISTEDSYAVVKDILYPQYTGSGSGAPEVPNTGSTNRTVRATVHIESIQVGTLSPSARGIVAIDYINGNQYLLAQAPNVPGTYELSGTINSSWNVKEVRLYNGSTGASGSPIWWDNFGVFYVPAGITVPGTPAYTGPYFDGSTPSSDTTQYAWVGGSDNGISQMSTPGAGVIWPFESTYYVDKVSAIAVGSSGQQYTEFFDGRTEATRTEVYFYTGDDENSTSVVYQTDRPAVDTYFDGNTASAVWNGATNASSSTLPGLPEIPKATMDINYRSAWID